MNQKGFIKTAIIFVIFVLIIGGLFVYVNHKNSSNLQKIYKNEKFGYQIVLPNNWSISKPANAQIDLARKYLTDAVNEEIFDYSGDSVTVKNQTKLDEIEKRIVSEGKVWDPAQANYIILTNATLEEQDAFYGAVIRKEKLMLIDFFPNRTIRIEPSEHIAQLTTTSTTTSKRIDKTIILSNGMKAEYKKLINPNIGATFVYVPMTSNELTYNGEKINSLQFTYLKDEISENDFIDIVNSVTFDR
ncbi:MAG: hypothetical protein Q8R08_00510 [bacterium]|nr:hypothetical protein [bacterium]